MRTISSQFERPKDFYPLPFTDAWNVFRRQRLEELSVPNPEVGGEGKEDTDLEHRLWNEWLGKNPDQIYGYDMEARRLKMLAADERDGIAAPHVPARSFPVCHVFYSTRRFLILIK